MQKPPTPVFRSVALVIVSLFFIVSISSIAFPQPVHASDINSPIQVAKDIFNSINTQITAITSQFQLTKGTVLDPLAYAVSQAALQAIVNSTVKWINSGFNGSPAFITNLNTTLLQVGDAQANSFIGQLNSNSAIKSPFQTQVASAVNSNYLKSTSANSFFSKNPFTLGSASPNPTAFLGGDFTQGGFDAWFSTNDNPANNPYGAYQIANQALNGQVAGAQSTQKTEAGWANGFLGYRGNCQTSTTGQINGTTVTAPPATLSTANYVPSATAVTTLPTTVGANPSAGLTLNQAAAAAASVGVGTASNNSSLNTSFSTAPAAATSISAATASTNATPSTVTSTSLSPSSGCQSQNIITPGSAIANSLYKSLGTGVDSLLNAKQFDQIVNALLGQLVNHVLGPGGLLGTTQPSAATGGVAYLNQTSSPTSASASLSSGFSQTLSTQLTGLQTFQASWTAIDQAALAAQTALQSNDCSANQATLTSTVQPVLNQATTELSDANASITGITNIQNELPPANSTTDETAQLSQVSSDYSALLASPTYPSAADFSNASTESVNTGTSTAPSTLSEMNLIAQGAAAACGVPTTTTTVTTSQ